MVQFSSFLSGLTKNISPKSGKKRRINLGRETTEALAKEARKNGLLLTSPGTVCAKWSGNYMSAYSKGGNKGINQDCFIVWEGFGGKENVMFCGVFDGHGPWGHLVGKRVKKVMPAYLLHYWQEAMAQCSILKVGELFKNENFDQFSVWKQSLIKACSTVDYDLELHPIIDSLYSGTAALTIIREGDLIVLANVGDSRAVLGTTADDGSMVAVQLTVDFKPNLPQERERIYKSGGSVCESDDEPGVSRIHDETPEGPGLALSRAFGDFFVKDLGLISEPDVTQRTLTTRDHFVILATDGVWDVVSNEKAVEIVSLSSATERDEAAKRVVEYAAAQWKCKRAGFAADDISVVCVFFNNPSSSSSSSSSHQH
ncbi:hypothetical protein R6Q59_022111 [Mikania micrantha]